MIGSYSLLEFCTFTDFVICFFVLFLFCNCHCFACAVFFVRACPGVCYLTVFWGFFLWVGIWPVTVVLPGHTKYSFQP